MPAYAHLTVARALRNRDPGLLQIVFDALVLERYRADERFSIIRTNSAGRVKMQGGWSLDFGIARDDKVVHAAWGALTANLPDTDLAHWAEHALEDDLSENFLRMQLSPGSCFDDGELRTW